MKPLLMRALLAKSRCLGDSLIERSSLTMQQLDTLNRQLQAVNAALDGHLGRGG
jgi:hypothetical protein